MARAAKLEPTRGDVEAFLDSIPNEQRRADARTLITPLSEITGEQPVLWTANIIGFGEYRYVYESGHRGVGPLAGLSPRKDSLVIYLIGGSRQRYRRQLEKLGPHRAGKGCLYLKRLSDVDLDVRLRLITRAVDVHREMDRAALR